MKTLLLFFFVTVGFGAVAQRSSYSKNVTSDGQQLRIRVDVRDPDRSMHYDRSFDVSNWSRARVQALEKHVLDSLAIAAEPTHAAASQPTEELANGHAQSVAMVWNGRVPYQETVEENRAEGRLKVRFTFRADGQENIVERTAIIRDDSEAGRRKLRQAVERQLTNELEALVGQSGV